MPATDPRTEPRYYFALGDEQQGPCTADNLRALRARHEIDDATLIWRQGMDSWAPFRKIAELQPIPGAPIHLSPDLAEPDRYVSQVRPWLRFWARYIDLSLFAILFLALWLVAFGLADLFFNEAQLDLILDNTPSVVGLLLVALGAILFEAMLLSVIGTTAGKALFNIRIRAQNGKLLRFPQALTRTFTVYLRGLGFAVIPIVTMVTMIVAYNRLTAHGITSWDAAGNVSYRHGRMAIWRVPLAILFLVLPTGAIFAFALWIL